MSRIFCSTITRISEVISSSRVSPFFLRDKRERLFGMTPRLPRFDRVQRRASADRQSDRGEHENYGERENTTALAAPEPQLFRRQHQIFVAGHLKLSVISYRLLSPALSLFSINY